jgi:hypothetical protein
MGCMAWTSILTAAPSGQSSLPRTLSGTALCHFFFVPFLIIAIVPVLRIRDVYPGSSFSPSQIQQPTKNKRANNYLSCITFLCKVAINITKFEIAKFFE